MLIKTFFDLMPASDFYYCPALQLLLFDASAAAVIFSRQEMPRGRERERSMKKSAWIWGVDFVRAPCVGWMRLPACS